MGILTAFLPSLIGWATGDARTTGTSRASDPWTIECCAAWKAISAWTFDRFIPTCRNGSYQSESLALETTRPEADGTASPTLCAPRFDCPFTACFHEVPTEFKTTRPPAHRLTCLCRPFNERNLTP